MAREREELERGEVTYARLGDSVVTGEYVLWLLKGGTYGDDTSHAWTWFLDGVPLTVEDQDGNPYVLPTDNAILERLAEGELVVFQQRNATTWVTEVSTYYSHHLGSVSTNYHVTIDTAKHFVLIEIDSSVELDR